MPIRIEPHTAAFAEAVDLAASHMVDLGLEIEAMMMLAEELLHMFSNDSWKPEPAIPHSGELSRLMGGVLAYLRLASEGRAAGNEGEVLSEKLLAHLNALVLPPLQTR